MTYISYKTVIKKFDDYGDKTNWTYVMITHEQAVAMKHEKKTGFRIKGLVDKVTLDKVAVHPDGQGNFFFPLKESLRKELKKQADASVQVKIAVDDVPPPINEELIECLKDEPKAWTNFSTLRRSHQLYFSNWVNSAKTEATKSTRIAHCVNALSKNFDYGQMIRSLKKDKEN